MKQKKHFQKISLMRPYEIWDLIYRDRGQTREDEDKLLQYLHNLDRIISSQDYREKWFYDNMKRGLDVIGATSVMAVLLPLMVVVALIIICSSTGPALYRQRRLTSKGRTFLMYKFRTMSANAEAETGAVWAKDQDPRVTPIGRLLRMTRLDELPQLINVVIGDMSLVGPRPERPEIADELLSELPDFDDRHKIRGGVTGLAQVAYGYASSVSDYKKKLEMDLLYIRHRSFSLDFVIFCRTVFVLIDRHGAR